MTDSSGSGSRTHSPYDETFVKLDESDHLSSFNYNSSTMDDNECQLYRRMTVHIADKSALDCKNGCGFYGNREWDGYCSICYKQIRLGKLSSPSADTTMNKTLQPLSSSSVSLKNKISSDSLARAQSASSLSQPSSFLSNASGLLSFRKFEEKKRQQADKKSLKSIFKRASTFREYRSTSSHSSTSSNSDNNSWQFFSLEKPLMIGEEMLAKLFRDDIVPDINANINKCVDKINRMLQRHASIDELTECIHEFYAAMKNRFQTHPNYKEVQFEQLDQLIDQTENMLLDKLYGPLFARVQSEDEERDLQLQKMIRNLNWIMSNHLDLDINLRHPQVKDLLDKAITEIIELDSRHIPLEKLELVVKCSKTIIQMLQVNNNDAISADQFLPALVFVVIKANPPLLQSNIKFISRFSTPHRLMSGEAGYYFTNLCCATTFIEKICGKSLNMSESDFESYMNGEAQPPGYYKQTFLCDAFRILNTNYAMLSDTMDRNAQCESHIESLSKRLNRFIEQYETRSMSTIESSKNTIKQCLGYKIFEKDIDPSLLPSHFQAIYVQQRENRIQQQSAILIDIESSVRTDNVDVCSQLNSLELNANISEPTLPKQLDGTNIGETQPLDDDEIARKLPVPLSPQVVSQQ